MGYCDEKGRIICNYEKLDISKNPFETKWKILSINNYCGLSVHRIYNAVTFIKNNNYEEEDDDKLIGIFYFYGGS